MNRKDYTKKYVSRSVSNPCSYDHNMRSHGATSHVKHQLTFTGGINSFIGEDNFLPMSQPEQNSSRVGSAQQYVGGLFYNRPVSTMEPVNGVHSASRPITADPEVMTRRITSGEVKKSLEKASNEALRLTSKKLRENGSYVNSPSGKNSRFNEKVSNKKVSYKTVPVQSKVKKEKPVKEEDNCDMKKLEDNVTEKITAILEDSKVWELLKSVGFLFI